MDSSNTFSDSDSDTDIADLARDTLYTPPLPRNDADSEKNKIISNLSKSMKTQCQVVVVKSSTHPNIPKLEVADCIKSLLGHSIIQSDLPYVRDSFLPLSQTKKIDPNGSETEYLNWYRPDTMSFSLRTSLHGMVVPDFGDTRAAKATDIEELDSNIHTDSSVSASSSKEFISELLKSEDKLKNNRDQADNLLGEPSQVQNVPRPIQKPLKQPRRKRKNRRNRPMQQNSPVQQHDSHPASEPGASGSSAAAQQQMRDLKKEQKNAQREQRRRKRRG